MLCGCLSIPAGVTVQLHCMHTRASLPRSMRSSGWNFHEQRLSLSDCSGSFTLLGCSAECMVHSKLRH
jgi:hypothetical protein